MTDILNKEDSFIAMLAASKMLINEIKEKGILITSRELAFCKTFEEFNSKVANQVNIKMTIREIAEKLAMENNTVQKVFMRNREAFTGTFNLVGKSKKEFTIEGILAFCRLITGAKIRSERCLLTLDLTKKI